MFAEPGINNSEIVRKSYNLSWREYLFLGLFSLFFTVVAWEARPVWDDSWVTFVEAAGMRISELSQDRPIIGWIWERLIDHGVLWTSGVVIHWCAWFGLGSISSLLWLRLFPDFREFSLVVGCLTIFPVICKIQIVLIVTLIHYQLGICLAYGTLLGILNWLYGGSSPSPAALVLLLFLTFCTCLGSEYPTLALAAVGLLLPFLGGHFGLYSPRPRLRIAAVLLVVAFAGYVLYWGIANSAARPQVRPEMAVSSQGVSAFLLNGLQVYPAALWRLCFGSLFEVSKDFLVEAYVALRPALGYYTIVPASIPIFVISIMAGIFIGLALFWGTSGHGQEQGIEAQKQDPKINWLRFASIACALAIAVVPVVLLRPDRAASPSPYATRHTLSLLPLASCATVAFVLAIIPRRLSHAAILFLGFLAGFSGAAQALDYVSMQKCAHVWGEEIRPHLSEEGMTVALFEFEEIVLVRHFNSNSTITAQLSYNWNPKEKENFWAFFNKENLNEYCNVAGDSNVPIEINYAVRGLQRIGPISKFLILRIGKDASIEIEDIEVEHIDSADKDGFHNSTAS